MITVDEKFLGACHVCHVGKVFLEIRRHVEQNECFYRNEVISREIYCKNCGIFYKFYRARLDEKGED